MNILSFRFPTKIAGATNSQVSTSCLMNFLKPYPTTICGVASCALALYERSLQQGEKIT